MGTATGLGDGERDSESECGGESMTVIRNATCTGRGVSSVRKTPSYESINRHGVSSSKPYACRCRTCVRAQTCESRWVSSMRVSLVDRGKWGTVFSPSRRCTLPRLLFYFARIKHILGRDEGRI